MWNAYSGSILDTGIDLRPPNIAAFYQLPNMYRPPIPSNKSRIRSLSWVIEKFLNSSLCEGRMPLRPWGVSQVLCEAGSVADGASDLGTAGAISRWRVAWQCGIRHFWCSGTSNLVVRMFVWMSQIAG
jgi:hypothetical protein